MAEHKLAFGKEIINKLFNLGNVLEYHCEKEHPVNIENESAVDVAWLFESGQKYPLFIFEVESKTTNAIPANPLKIFGEDNHKFEKPLFLFHLLLTGGQESGKIQQLERTYGTYNYRIYRFSLEEETNLIKDILTQHRRLTNSLPVVNFITEITENWSNVDVNFVIFHIEELEFEKNSGLLLPSYALLSKKYPFVKNHFIRNLKKKAETPEALFDVESYGTYLGENWSIPIHLGLLSAFANDGLEAKYFEDFKNWQENSYYSGFQNCASDAAMSVQGAVATCSPVCKQVATAPCTDLIAIGRTKLKPAILQTNWIKLWTFKRLRFFYSWYVRSSSWTNGFIIL